MSKKKSSSNSDDLPDWKFRFGTSSAVRRTIEKSIRKSWGCDEKTAAREFDRALSRGELEEIKIGLSKEVTAYKLKQV